MDTTVPPAAAPSATTSAKPPAAPAAAKPGPATLAPAPLSLNDPSPTVPTSAVQAHEEWAKAKGHVVTTIRKNRMGQVVSVVVQPDWRLAALRAYHKIEAGQPMTEAEYDAKLDQVLAEPYGQHIRPSKWAPRQKPIKPGRSSKAIRLRSSQRPR